ncbi:MAG: sugar transferase [Paludibacteraceae bacterium]|nr:sugar transferase [Paludibacteraceae bacterium]
MLKFWFDRLSAFVGLVLCSWVLLLIALLIRLLDGASVLFCQRRVGKDGELFVMHKFRTMSEGNDGTTVTVAGDLRITKLGAFLRKTKLDELPELWDVFVGKMSMVGPRPDVPGYADKLQGEDREILSLRPGITGPATLKYRDEEMLLTQVENPHQYHDEVIYPDKVRLNRYYLHHYSFFLDLKIIFATLLGRKILFAGETI